MFFSVSNSVANLTRRNMLGRMLGSSFSVWVLMLIIAAVFTYFVTLIYNPIEVGADLMADGVELAVAQERSLGELIVNTVTVSDFQDLYSIQRTLKVQTRSRT